MIEMIRQLARIFTLKDPNALTDAEREVGEGASGDLASFWEDTFI